MFFSNVICVCLDFPLTWTFWCLFSSVEPDTKALFVAVKASPDLIDPMNKVVATTSWQEASLPSSFAPLAGT